MNITINSELIDDVNLSLNVLKVGQEHCDPRKKPETCVRPCYSLHFVLFGRGTLIDSEGKRYEINKNEAFLLYEHKQYSYSPDPRDPWSYIWVEFTGTGLDKLLSLCGFESGNVCKRIKDFSGFVDLMKNLCESYDASDVQQLRCSAYLMLIFGKFIEHEREGRVSPRIVQKKKTLRNILIYINNNYSMTTLTNEVIACMNGLSVRSLTALFDEMLGMSPVEYINNYRVSVACECFSRADMSVAEVARYAGFDDEKYFSRVFKRIKGVTPLEYKKSQPQEDYFAWIKSKGMLYR